MFELGRVKTPPNIGCTYLFLLCLDLCFDFDHCIRRELFREFFALLGWTALEMQRKLFAANSSSFLGFVSLDNGQIPAK